MNYNHVGWFEIPVVDMDRARKFYEAVFDITIEIHDMGGVVMGWFPGAEKKPGATGTLIKHEMYSPSNTHGVLIYFSCEDLDNELGRVEKSGGKVLRPKTEIGGGHGYMGLFLDCEGNRLALHSLK